MHFLALLWSASVAFASPYPYVSVNGCSGVLAAPPGRASTAPALVLTNGHCLDFRYLLGGDQPLPPAGAIYHDVTAPFFLNSILISVQASSGRESLPAARVIFTSMDGTDLALIELNSSYADIALRHGVAAAPLSFGTPPPGSRVNIRAGYFNRDFTCELGEAVRIREGGYRWPDSLRLRRGCEIYPGVSGAPVIAEASQAVFALANTHNSGSRAACSVHNPCEVDEEGNERTGSLDQSYAVSLAPLAHCFNTAGEAKFASAPCPFRP